MTDYTVIVEVATVRRYYVPARTDTEAEAAAAAVAALKASAGSGYSYTETVPSFTAARAVKLSFVTEKATP